MKDLLNKIPPIFKNFYFLAALAFLIWMAFLDGNDLFTQSKLSSKEKQLKKAKTYYEDKIIEVKNQKEAITNDPEALERIAREKYLMKKKEEDLYVIVDEEKK